MIIVSQTLIPALHSISSSRFDSTRYGRGSFRYTMVPLWLEWWSETLVTPLACKHNSVFISDKYLFCSVGSIFDIDLIILTQNTEIWYNNFFITVRGRIQILSNVQIPKSSKTSLKIHTQLKYAYFKHILSKTNISLIYEKLLTPWYYFFLISVSFFFFCLFFKFLTALWPSQCNSPSRCTLFGTVNGVHLIKPLPVLCCSVHFVPWLSSSLRWYL